jgi:hypothetical protein
MRNPADFIIDAKRQIATAKWLKGDTAKANQLLELSREFLAEGDRGVSKMLALSAKREAMKAISSIEMARVRASIFKMEMERARSLLTVAGDDGIDTADLQNHLASADVHANRIQWHLAEKELRRFHAKLRAAADARKASAVPVDVPTAVDVEPLPTPRRMIIHPAKPHAPEPPPPEEIVRELENILSDLDIPGLDQTTEMQTAVEPLPPPEPEPVLVPAESLPYMERGALRVGELLVQYQGSYGDAVEAALDRMCKSDEADGSALAGGLNEALAPHAAAVSRGTASMEFFDAGEGRGHVLEVRSGSHAGDSPRPDSGRGLLGRLTMSRETDADVGRYLVQTFVNIGRLASHRLDPSRPMIVVLVSVKPDALLDGIDGIVVLPGDGGGSDIARARALADALGHGGARTIIAKSTTVLDRDFSAVEEERSWWDDAAMRVATIGLCVGPTVSEDALAAAIDAVGAAQSLT